MAILANPRNLSTLSVASTHNTRSKFAANRLILYELNKSQTRLSELIEQVEVRVWIQDAGQPVFLITALITAVDQRVEHFYQKSLDISSCEDISSGLAVPEFASLEAYVSAKRRGRS